MLLLIQSEFEGEKTIFTNLVIITLKKQCKGKKIMGIKMAVLEFSNKLKLDCNDMVILNTL